MKTLWSQAVEPDQLMMRYTVGEDRHWDSFLLRWDILGSLGHVEGLAASKLVTRKDRDRLRAGLRSALKAVDAGRLRIEAEHEDAHSAVETWLTKRLGATGERLHTGRSRNDQIATDLRLFLKDELLTIERRALDVAEALLGFASLNEMVLWPGYTHLRRAMPSSAGLWASALAESIFDTVESLDAVWRTVDRSPLGSGAGYGVPLPLDREASARALGFAGVERNVAQIQNGRGKIEAAVLFWCGQLGFDLGKLSADVILLSGEEFGLLTLPARFATGSSIMPHKRNPDVFELTRARAAALDGDLAAVMALRGKLTSGYHRDFQLLKEPLIRGVRRTAEMLEMVAAVVPELAVARERARELLSGGVLATDEVMRRVDEGTPFRRAYREVAGALKRNEALPEPSPAEIAGRRQSTGGIGRLGLAVPQRRLSELMGVNEVRRRAFTRAMTTLAGRG